MDSIWHVVGTDTRSRKPVDLQLIAGSEAEARSMAAAIHVQVSAVQRGEPSAGVSAALGQLMFCPRCRTIAEPESRYQGTRAISTILCLLFFPAAILYELWRHMAGQWVCPNCGVAGMIPRKSAPVDDASSAGRPPQTPPAV